MEDLERSRQIREHLSIKRVNHGQLYSFQIAVPEPEKKVHSERRELLKEILNKYGVNLVSLIVRPTYKYSEEEEYEVVYNADWVVVAQEIGIQKLWAWVFDLTDDEAEKIVAEMNQLFEKSNRIRQLEAANNTNSKPSKATERKDRLPVRLERKLNLLEVTKEEIEKAIKAEASSIKIAPVWDAIDECNRSSQGLTWENLENSVTGRADSKKIKGYGREAYKLLKHIGDIPS